MSKINSVVALEPPSFDELVTRHAPLVKRIAYHLMNRLPPNVQADDMIQNGMLGLLEASRNYDPSQGASFGTYAGIRIRGAMLDEIRRSDWTPRSVYRKARMISEARREIENEQGCEASDMEVARALDMRIKDYHAVLSDVSSCRVFSLDGALFEDNHDDSNDNRNNKVSRTSVACDTMSEPFANLQKKQLKKDLDHAIKSLPEREHLAITLRYDEELNLREIGQVLGVSESRACQIHSQAVLRLRSRLSYWLDYEETKK
ncbi:RNA polymerase sigma factor FliA [Patescibacteria group bacterium]